jgi:Ca2+-binding RTX toxin-like protein
MEANMAINGTNGQDFLDGTRFNDEINGLQGDDFIEGSPGSDRLDGGLGTDTVDYYFFDGFLNVSYGDSVNVDLQRATQQGGLAEGDVLISIENVGGSREDDVIKGDGGANKLLGNGGSDILEGRDGDDDLFGDASASFLGGVQGNDVLDGGAGNDRLFGEGGNDTLIGGTGTNLLDGGVGTDTASYAGSAFGMLVAITGSNSNGVALSLGSTDGDSLISIENIVGSNFVDSIAGSAIANVIDGGGGNDLISGGGGADSLSGGGGTDTASYAGSSAGVNVNLGTVTPIITQAGIVFIQSVAGTGTGGEAQGDTLRGFENLLGSNFADTLTGNIAANRLDGGAGEDTLDGGGGNDTLVGGAGVGRDSLDGGAGADTFLYQSLDDSRIVGGGVQDIIGDFTVGQDKLDFRPLSVDATDLIIVNQVGKATVGIDQNGNDTFDEGEFAITVNIANGLALTVNDFLL